MYIAHQTSTGINGYMCMYRERYMPVGLVYPSEKKVDSQVDDVRSHLFEAETLLDKTNGRKDFTILFVWGFFNRNVKVDAALIQSLMNFSKDL